MIFLQPFPNRGLSFYRPKYTPILREGCGRKKTVCPARDKYQTCQQHKSVLHQLCDCQRMFKVVSICLVGEEKARQTLRRKRLTVRCNQAQYVCRGRILHFLPLNFSRFHLFWYLLCRMLLLQMLDATNLPFFLLYISYMNCQELKEAWCRHWKYDASSFRDTNLWPQQLIIHI